MQPQFSQPLGGERLVRVLPGQYYDVEKASNYNYFRDYDPSTGRYVESDPIGLKGGLNTFGYVSANPVNAWDDFGLCETIVSAKTHWQLASDNDEVMHSLSFDMPVYRYESHSSSNWNVRKNPLQPPLKPSMCYHHVGDDLITIELMHNVQFWQNIAYQQTCSTCTGCSGGDGPMSCGDWKDMGAIDAKEITSYPWLRTRRSYESVSAGPCIEVPVFFP
jgi:RHS repeat-associated protein